MIYRNPADATIYESEGIFSFSNKVIFIQNAYNLEMIRTEISNEIAFIMIELKILRSLK